MASKDVRSSSEGDKPNTSSSSTKSGVDITRTILGDREAGKVRQQQAQARMEKVLYEQGYAVTYTKPDSSSDRASEHSESRDTSLITPMMDGLMREEGMEKEKAKEKVWEWIDTKKKDHDNIKLSHQQLEREMEAFNRGEHNLGNIPLLGSKMKEVFDRGGVSELKELARIVNDEHKQSKEQHKNLGIQLLQYIDQFDAYMSQDSSNTRTMGRVAGSSATWRRPQ